METYAPQQVSTAACSQCTLSRLNIQVTLQDNAASHGVDDVTQAGASIIPQSDMERQKQHLVRAHLGVTHAALLSCYGTQKTQIEATCQSQHTSLA